MADFRVEIDTSKATPGLRRIRDSVSGKNGDLMPTRRNLGILGLRMMQDQLQSGGDTYGEKYPPVGVVTKALRISGSGKCKSVDELRAKAANPLLDKGKLRLSLRQGGSGNVYDVSSNDSLATVGTALDYARIHDQGGSSTFVFGPEQEARLAKNMSEAFGGSPPGRTPTGRKSRAKKRWNQEYFKFRASLRKMNGKSYKVPRRRLVPDTMPSRYEDMARKIVEQGLSEVAEAATK